MLLQINSSHTATINGPNINIYPKNTRESILVPRQRIKESSTKIHFFEQGEKMNVLFSSKAVSFCFLPTVQVLSPSDTEWVKLSTKRLLSLQRLDFYS